MENSILKSIKQLLNLEADHNAFDQDIIIQINSAFMILNQLGVGPVEPFEISGEDEEWSDFFGDTPPLAVVKTYVYIKTRLGFDPPTSSFGLTAMQEMAEEYEWRLNSMVDPGLILPRLPLILEEE